MKVVISRHTGTVIRIAAILLLACGSSLANTGAAEAPAGLLCDLLEHPEETVITTAVPFFDWIYNPSFPDDAQSGYHIIVASSETSAMQGVGDVWDSGMVDSRSSINVLYAGSPLKGNTDYFWRVQTLDSSGHTSPFSVVQHFHTDSTLTAQSNSPWSDPIGVPLNGLVYNASSNAWANRYPLRLQSMAPVWVTNTAPGRWFIDFGQDAFGYATIHLKGAYSGKEIQARFGEMASGNTVDSSPPCGSSVRYTNVDVTLQNGDHIYAVHPGCLPDYDGHGTINPPGNFGTVMPFRYLELTNFPGMLNPASVAQERLLDEFNTNAATFNSSSPALNQIWNLCHHSMQMLSFDGIYVDGDRERTPYEADCYIHQLSAYAMDREFTMLRYSFEYLLQHPTWPTEWKFHMIFIAWTDYLQTGNADFLYRYYDALKPDLFTWAATGDGLMRGFPNYPTSRSARDSDVIDWPPVDRDGFVIKAGKYLNWTNSVNNAFYYRSLQMMSGIAAVIGRTNDAANYSKMAQKVYAEYNATFWNSNSQCYVDGVGTVHASAHANFFPLAFGLVPANRETAVIGYLHSRIGADNGMPASVYGAQYLLEGLFEHDDADAALGLMTTNGPRGWLNMINMGSTLTTEAWSFDDKKNTDWNHAWGAAPANLISRFVLGVRPITPGYSQILIQPQLGRSLSYVRGTVPTIRGSVSVQVTESPTSFSLVAGIPGNVDATIMLPAMGTTNVFVREDGNLVAGTLVKNWLVINNVGSGRHVITRSPEDAPLQVTWHHN